MVPQVKTGTTTGTGAAIDVECGFVPKLVRIFNITDGDQIDEWIDTMAAGTSLQINTAVAIRSTNGVTAFTGSATKAPGFTIGSGISESAKVLHWYAVG